MRLGTVLPFLMRLKRNLMKPLLPIYIVFSSKNKLGQLVSIVLIESD